MEHAQSAPDHPVGEHRTLMDAILHPTWNSFGGRLAPPRAPVAKRSGSCTPRVGLWGKRSKASLRVGTKRAASAEAERTEDTGTEATTGSNDKSFAASQAEARKKYALLRLARWEGRATTPNGAAVGNAAADTSDEAGASRKAPAGASASADVDARAAVGAEVVGMGSRRQAAEEERPGRTIAGGATQRSGALTASSTGTPAGSHDGWSEAAPTVAQPIEDSTARHLDDPQCPPAKVPRHEADRDAAEDKCSELSPYRAAERAPVGGKRGADEDNKGTGVKRPKPTPDNNQYRPPSEASERLRRVAERVRAREAAARAELQGNGHEEEPQAAVHGSDDGHGPIT